LYVERTTMLDIEEKTLAGKTVHSVGTGTLLD